MDKHREVVITGMGLASPVGHTPETFFANLLEGKSGVSNITRFDTSAYAVHFAGEIKEFDGSRWFDAKELGRTSRYIQYIVHAALHAVESAGLNQGKLDVTRAGMVLGSGMGGIEVFTENAAALETKGPKRVSPFFIPMSITNMGSGMVAMRLGWRGPNWSVSSACATGNHAFSTASDQIRMGRADVMLAGGSEEAVCAASLAGFASMRALSRRNDDPATASRPFDSDRDGFVLGEGAGVLVLEAREHAERRGAKILGVLRGFGNSCDAYHISAPLETGDGVCQAVEAALREAGVDKSEIGVVNAHATSTPLGDVAEVRAMTKVFGPHLKRMKVHSTKSMTGHLLGGASAIEAIALVMTLNSGDVHPTLNVMNQDPEIDIDCVPNKKSRTNARFGISNSFGFGGHNSCIVIEKGA
ncbi:MAG TPA: beta-ketoacyl-ACP synthase II [Fibrobacteria bacterium]|nr:beta-ketoacyl-ACP synthase II [Fibrobacteria bacterium]